MIDSQEFAALQKMRTYANFSLDYTQNQLPTNKISQEKAMMLENLAREKQIPKDIPILKKLNESVAKFEKFRKDYAEYRKFRERMSRQNPDHLVFG